MLLLRTLPMATTLTRSSALPLDEYDFSPADYAWPSHPPYWPAPSRGKRNPPESIASAIERLLAEAPPLTAHRRDRISTLLSGARR